MVVLAPPPETEAAEVAPAVPEAAADVPPPEPVPPAAAVVSVAGPSKCGLASRHADTDHAPRTTASVERALTSERRPQATTRAFYPETGAHASSETSPPRFG